MACGPSIESLSSDLLVKVLHFAVEDVHDAMATESAAMRDLLVEAARHQSQPPERPLRVLDFGCGDGRYLHEFVRAGAYLCGGRPEQYSEEESAPPRLQVVAKPTFSELATTTHCGKRRRTWATVSSGEASSTTSTLGAGPRDAVTDSRQARSASGSA